MRIRQSDLDFLEEEVPDAKSGCSRWQPHREMRPIGFAAPHSLEDWSDSPAIAPQNVRRLAAELAQLRAEISRQLNEIQRKLSQAKNRPSRSHGMPRTRESEGQHVLPFLPPELSRISDAIEHSKAICRRPPDPSDELALECSPATWQRATKVLFDHALSIWEKAKVAIRPPVISAGPDGSLDLYWTAAPYGLLLNVPADPKQPATYFGDDAANPDTNRTSGKLDPTKPIDIGILMWLAHTAEE